MSVFGVFPFRIFLHSNWIQRKTEYLSVSISNAGEHGPEKLWIQRLSMQRLWLSFLLCHFYYFEKLFQTRSSQKPCLAAVVKRYSVKYFFDKFTKLPERPIREVHFFSKVSLEIHFDLFHKIHWTSPRFIV